jgi:hypothetical protein
MRPLFIALFIQLLWNISIPVEAQHNGLKSINSFIDQTSFDLQEKIHAHLDRPDHITGEILWFKIYCVEAMHHTPLDLSKIAYVEILDRDNQPVLQTKVSLDQGMGSGSFFIPATLPTGNYLFRAYTNWMKNMGPEFFFKQEISIINTLKASEEQASIRSNSALSIQFFPEGGQLIENLTSRVAFQLLDGKGNGVNGYGVILNQSNDTIIKFKPLKFGLGSFLLTPKPNNIYRAEIKSNGQRLRSSIPSVSKSGYVLSVTDSTGGKLKVMVSNSDPTFRATLFVHTRRSIKLLETKDGSKGVVVYIVDKNVLGNGISHFTIFDNDNKPVCERLYFKKPIKNLEINTKLDQSEYSIRRKVNLSISYLNPTIGEVSISVFRADSLSMKENILTDLFLTSDLVGSIESPNFYFSNDPMVEQAADNLMLTHGWRRFNWLSTLAAKQNGSKYLPETNGHIVTGKILSADGKPMQGKIGYLATPGKKVQLYVAKSDSMGNVLFQVNRFKDSGKLIAQTNYETDSLCHITINNSFSDAHSTWKPREVKLSHTMENGLLSRSIAMQVQDIYYEDETYFKFEEMNQDSIPFYGAADEVYNLDDYTRFPVMEEVLREYVKAVWVRKKKDKFRLMVLDKRRNNVFEENPLTLLDGVPVFNINQLMEIDPLKIKKMEVLSRRYFLGPLDLKGIVSLSTYNGDLGGIKLDDRSVILDYEAFQRRREFYSPIYSKQALRESRLPDQRTLIHWAPQVKILPGKETSIEFYTSDVEGKYYVVVEGIAKDGSPGSAIASFRVSQ